jgi:hypothetical protein
MFIVHKPEFSLVTGDILTYRCEGHDLIYDDLRMIYNDGLFTYERNRFDPAWKLIGTNQPKQIDIDWLSPTRFAYFFFVKHDLKGVLKCIGVKIWTPPPPLTVTDTVGTHHTI